MGVYFPFFKMLTGIYIAMISINIKLSCMVVLLECMAIFMLALQFNIYLAWPISGWHIQLSCPETLVSALSSQSVSLLS